MNTHRADAVSRRDLLKLAAAGAAGMVVAGNAPPAFAKDPTDPYGGFKMGMQSYSLRGFDTEEALKHTQTLGLKYWESFPQHIPTSTLPANISKYKSQLHKAGVTLLAYGVVNFDANETKSRELFDFAKALGMISLSANPKKDAKTFDLLDKLVAEYDIAIAIHNHGPGATYDKIADVEKMVKNRHPKIGACVDTGHYIRSDEDPVEAIERLGKRVFGVHLKDVKTLTDGDKRKKLFTILGQGDLNTLACLKALRQLKFDYALSLEYEENPKNPLSDIEISLRVVRESVASLG